MLIPLFWLNCFAIYEVELFGLKMYLNEHVMGLLLF